MSAVAADAGAHGVRLTAKRKTLLKTSLASRDETAEPVIKKVHRKEVAPDALRGLYPATIDGKPAVVEYEPDTNLRDTEQIPLLEEGGIESFIRREVLPYAPDAWYAPVQRQDRVRDQLHPPLLQAPATPPAGRDTGGYIGA